MLNLQSDLSKEFFESQPDPVSDHPILGMHIWGWTSSGELKWLNETAKKMNSIIEIGSLHGRSAFALLSGCKGNVYCIDPWNDVGGHSYPSFMSSCGHFKNLVPVQGYSHEVHSKLPDVDFTFIDGDHDREQVEKDIKFYLPKTRKLIAGHDYLHDGGFPDVAEVVDEVFGRENVRVVKDTAIWYVEL